MISRASTRAVFVIGFVLLLVDGAAAIWLGQISGKNVLVGVGVLLVLAAGGLVLAYRRWMQALAAIEEARADLHAEIARLRVAVQHRDRDSF